MMKILIVEPHPDDAILSVFGATKKWIAEGNEVSIVTCSNKPKISSQSYCDLIGAKFVASDTFSDLDFKTHRLPFNVIKEQGSQSYLYQRDHYINSFKQSYDAISAWAMGLVDQYDMAVYPVGLLHPFHVAVGTAFEAAVITHNVSALCYADMPYANKVYGKTLIDSACSANILALYEEFKLDPVDTKHKLSLFHTLYKGESIHWDEPGMYQNSEKLYSYC